MSADIRWTADRGVEVFIGSKWRRLFNDQDGVFDDAELSTNVPLKDAFNDFSGSVMATEAGAGITDGTGTVYASSVEKVGGIFKTKILIDLTGLSSATSNLDVIGVGAGVAHIGQITAARNGTIVAGLMTCHELPSTLTDIDLYSAALGTYVFEDLITDDAAEVALVTRGAAWVAGDRKIFTGLPTANQYLYLVNGAADTADPFTAGKFLIELYGV